MNKPAKSDVSDFNAELKLKGFKVYQIDEKSKNGHSYNRKDFYKISLNTSNIQPTLIASSKIKPVIYRKRKEHHSFDFYTYFFVFFYFCNAELVNFVS
jgi:hypothetical protein